VLARGPAGTSITIAFYAPTSQPAGWGRAGLRERAESLPGVRIIDDIDGREASLFGAVNSGHTVVYGPDGKLWFHGGITASRGHEGDNLGADCVVAALNNRALAATTTPTFGCEIAPRNEGSECPLCMENASR